MNNLIAFPHRVVQALARWISLALLAASLLVPVATRAGNPTPNLFEPLVVEPSVGTFPLVAAGTAAPLWFDAADHKGVLRAVGDLQADIARVTGLKPAASAQAPASGQPVIISTSRGRRT